MTMGARCGSFALGLSLLLMSGSVWAQTDPQGSWTDPQGSWTDPQGSWTDPPVRGAAPATTEEPPKSEESASAREKRSPEATKPVESAAAPPVARPKGITRAQTVQRSAKLRREQIRHVATPAKATAASQRVERQHAFSERPRHHVERRSYAYRGYRSQPPRYRAYARRNDESGYDDMGAAPHRGRRAGWGGLVEGGDPARRIAQARAAGYLVVRSRTYLYPDGTRVRSLRPMEPSYDPDDLF